MIKQKFMLRMLFRYLLALLLPTILMGSIFAVAGYYYLKEQYRAANLSLLEATLTQTELMLNELDSMILSFDGNADTINRCWHVLNTSRLGYQENQDLNNIVNVISAPVNARGYLDSIYIYYPNPYGRYILSKQGIVTLREEEGWYESYLEHLGREKIWSERRRLDDGTEVVSVYQVMKHKGVVVLNLNARNVERILHSISSFDGQGIYILDNEMHILFQEGKDYGYTGEELGEFLQSMGRASRDDAENVIHTMSSPSYRWHYISVIPNRVFYRLPILIIQSTCLIVLFLLAAGIVLSYFVSRQNYRIVGNVIQLLDAAREGKTLEPQARQKFSDYASAIIQELIQNFVQQDYLKVQLSEKKYKLRSMELLAMQSQMNPHFLYNTLETINWEIMGLTGERNKVNEMVENLSEILAYSLDSRREYVPLSEEIHITKCYISLLQNRYGDTFRAEWKYEEAVLEANVVKFILQPLVENAVNHGIRAREDGYGGIIRIRIRQKGDVLVIRVVDNGVGIGKEKLENLRRDLQEGAVGLDHIGIFNTNKRLQLAYGEDAGIWIGSRKGLGTMVRLLFSIDGSGGDKVKN